MRKLLQSLLAWKARKIIAKYNPKVIAVTGSVGKTSTRQAIATLLASKWRVRSPIANFNNEIGVPLTIIGKDSPGRSIVGWIGVLWAADKMLLTRDKNFPEMLVLEYGADHPGDIKALCDIAEPDIGVLTAVSPVHAEHFGTVERLTKEKAEIIRRAKTLAILNADDARVMGVREQAKAHVVTYGYAGNANVRAENTHVHMRDDFSFEPGEGFSTITFDVRFDDGPAKIELKDFLGRSIVSAVTAAVAVGRALGMEAHEMAVPFTMLDPVPGRLRPLPGIKRSLVLDDSYNAAPASVMAALSTLEMMPIAENARRISALGSMAELGEYTGEEHRRVGFKVAEAGIDYLVTVGDNGKLIQESAVEAGVPEAHAVHFNTSEEAGRHLDEQVKRGDIILVKGSQSTRMEKVVKDLMAEPLRAKELLVRQSEKWLKS